MKIADAIANFTKSVSSLASKVFKYKEKAEGTWNTTVATTEASWSFFKTALTAIEKFWTSLKSSIETAWKGFWSNLSEPSQQEAINKIIASVSVDDIAEEVGRGSRRVGVNIGLLFVDKSVYGTEAKCPGASRDATNMNRLLNRLGFSTKLFLNSEATWYAVKTHLERLAAELQPGDLLVLTAAGHGGQLRDANGDEKDGMDETWLLYDNEVRDDEILKIIKKFKPGVRLVFINDQCHSEGNFRSFTRGLQRVVSFGMWGKREAVPLSVQNTNGNLPALIQFAGCRESKYSYGGDSGGEWTAALIKTFAVGITWREWFEKASKIPRKQTPQWVEYGPVDDSFRNGKALV